ncbi:exonuclease SbcC [Actinomadura fulvescens]|uniref:Imm-5-like domain-containing protein n=1 Tax=Actinomadura fulvescens TaxID=46160 RepID=A0ABN3Q2L2_9ACTN
MATVSGDFELTMDELRDVARYVAESAQDILPVFEEAVPGDPRPRAALDAAWAFVNGAKRTKLQRVTSLDAHRAAKEAGTETARLAARAAGDAAYLHPISRAAQVGHILRAAASAARIAELNAGDDSSVGDMRTEQARQRATPTLISVLSRYPLASTAQDRVARLMSALDALPCAHPAEETPAPPRHVLQGDTPDTPHRRALGATESTWHPHVR